jgi:hypothetical protein
MQLISRGKRGKRRSYAARNPRRSNTKLSIWISLRRQPQIEMLQRFTAFSAFRG